MASILRSSRASSSTVARSARTTSLRFTSSEPAFSQEVSTPAPDLPTSPVDSPSSSSSPKPISVQHLLHRRPFLTPPVPPVLSAIRDYNSRLSLALSSPLPTHLYFKPGTLPARRYTYEAALLEHDVFGTPLPENLEVIEKDQAVLEIRERDALEKEEMDENGVLGGRGTKSANREGGKSLYLVVRMKEGGWQFPGGDGRQAVEGREEGKEEYLHDTTALLTHSLLGPDLSLWPVTRMPIAHIPASPSSPSSAPTFIFKSHALAGHPVLTARAREVGLEDWAWLTKEEIRELVEEKGSEGEKRWWEAVKDVLNEH